MGLEPTTLCVATRSEQPIPLNGAPCCDAAAQNAEPGRARGRRASPQQPLPPAKSRTTGHHRPACTHGGLRSGASSPRPTAALSETDSRPAATWIPISSGSPSRSRSTSSATVEPETDTSAVPTTPRSGPPRTTMAPVTSTAWTPVQNSTSPRLRSSSVWMPMRSMSVYPSLSLNPRGGTESNSTAIVTVVSVWDRVTLVMSGSPPESPDGSVKLSEASATGERARRAVIKSATIPHAALSSPGGRATASGRSPTDLAPCHGRLIRSKNPA